MKTGINSMAIVGLSLLTLAGAKAQTTITAWNFENDTIATNNAPAPSTGSGVATPLGMNLYATPNIGVTAADVLAGKASDTGSNTVADTTHTWRIRGQAGSNGAANGWSSLAPIGTQGAEFTVSTAGFNSISVSFDWYVTSQGEANLQFEYTTNVNATSPIWNNVALALDGSDAGLQVLSDNGSDTNTVTGSYVSDNLLNNANAGQDWFTALTATISDPNAANDPNFAFKLVNASTGIDDISSQGTALNNNSGNWRFDNVRVSGTSAVPEPSSYALFLGGMALVAGLMIRRKPARS
jgi:hypothetical protein